MKPSITVIHATLGRPHKAFQTYKVWRARAGIEQSRLEYIFVVNADDPSAITLKLLTADADAQVIEAAVKYSAPAWNVGANAANGTILVQGQDDVEPPQDWAKDLIWTIEEWCPLDVGFDEFPAVIAVSDGYRKGEHGKLCTTAICTKAYRDLEGHFLFPGYRSVFSDDEFTYRALRHDRDGTAKLIDCRDRLVFKHQHHYHVKGPKGEALVPWDETYAHENSAEAYAMGKRLFDQRNPRAATDGLKTW